MASELRPSRHRDTASKDAGGEFPHIRRLQDPRFPHAIAAILPGEFFVSRQPMVVYTVLGSCVSACIRDLDTGIGGMNHFMLPLAAGHATDWRDPACYGSYAMEVLINEIVKRGGRKDRLEVKVFGGGKIYESTMDVGAMNATWVMAYLSREGLVPVNQDLGDIYPRKIYYFTASGRVLLKKIQRLKNQTIMERERHYQLTLQQKARVNDLTLFQP